MFFNGRRVLITGGSSGIGLALARQLTQQGVHVGLIARNPERLQVALAAMESLRVDAGQCLASTAGDVSDATQVEAAIEEISARLGGTPNVLINSAGAAQPGYVEELPNSVFEEMMQVNYFGTVYTIKALLPKMLEQGQGNIVNISSLAGLLGVFGYTAYGAAKYAVRGFSDALRAELRPKGIKVSIVFPPDTDTPQLAYENLYKPAETRALVSSTHMLSPEAVAASILRGVSAGRYLILPGLEAKLIYTASSLAGPLTYPILDWLLRKNSSNR